MKEPIDICNFGLLQYSVPFSNSEGFLPCCFDKDRVARVGATRVARRLSCCFGGCLGWCFGGCLGRCFAFGTRWSAPSESSVLLVQRASIEVVVIVLVAVWLRASGRGKAVMDSVGGLSRRPFWGVDPTAFIYGWAVFPCRRNSYCSKDRDKHGEDIELQSSGYQTSKKDTRAEE